MNAIVPFRLQLPAEGVLWRPRDVTAIGLVINRLAELQEGPELEADIFRAMGWRVREPATPRSSWMTRSPFATHWMPLPPVTRCTDASRILRRPGWRCGVFEDKGHNFGWTRNPRNELRYFEQQDGTWAQVLARALLFSHRHFLITGEA